MYIQSNGEIVLQVSSDVATSTDAYDDYTPQSGDKIHLISFDGEAAFTLNSVVKLVWDYGGSEEIAYATKGSTAGMQFEYFIGTGDGTKKIALVCSNGESGTIVMSGRAKLRIT